MDEVDEKFSCGELFVPEMLQAVKAMEGGLEVLEPHPAAGLSQSKGTVVIGTIYGDLHDIGKNLVAITMAPAPDLPLSFLLERKRSKAVCSV